MITNERMAHSMAVARKMKEIANSDPQKYPVNPEEAFILGILHDIGYEFSAEQKDHGRIGGELLKNQGYQYWQEIYFHGTTQDKFTSPMLNLLNYADMTTGPQGQSLTVEERIQDIENRYGASSWQTTEAIALAKKLNI